MKAILMSPLEGNESRLHLRFIGSTVPTAPMNLSIDVQLNERMTPDPTSSSTSDSTLLSGVRSFSLRPRFNFLDDLRTALRPFLLFFPRSRSKAFNNFVIQLIQLRLTEFKLINSLIILKLY